MLAISPHKQDFKSRAFLFFALKSYPDHAEKQLGNMKITLKK